MAKVKWALVVGSRETGTAGAAARVAAGLAGRGVAVAGFVREAVLEDGERVGHRLRRLARDEAISVARTGSVPRGANEESFCSFVFDNDAFGTARRWLDEDAGAATVVMIDEVSKLEVAGKGHHDAVVAALASGSLAVLSVRGDQLFGVTERFALEDEPVASLESGDDEAVAAFVDAVARAAGEPRRRAACAGGVDWAETWQRMHDAVVAPTRGLRLEEGDRWQRRAERFDRTSRREGAADDVLAALAEQVRSDDVVIDVGAGAGRHAIPFARRCRHVIAVEPSPAMRARLERRAREEALPNLEIRSGSWPMEGAPEGDVVFSSHVLYGVGDATAFLRAMDRSARRISALYLGIVAPADALAPLWQRVHGAPRPRRPAALEALNLCHQLGLEASLVVLPGTQRLVRFGATDDDVTELCHRLWLEPSAESLARVRAAMQALSPAGEDGVHTLGVAGPNAIVWWPSRHGG